MRKPLRLSYSTLETANKCERLFALNKLYDIDEVEEEDPDDNPHFTYGTAFGIGIQSLFVHQDLDLAIFEAFKAYSFEETDTKCFEGIVIGLRQFHTSWDYSKYRIAMYKGKPAVELSFKIILDEDKNDYYCGFVDLILEEVATGIHYILELKTTGLGLKNLSPLYVNSAQGLGYTVLLDHISERGGMGVIYLVFQLNRTWIPKCHILPYHKSAKNRLGWLLTLQLDYDKLANLIDISFFPMRGSACLSFMRPCKLLGLCDMDWLTLPEAPIKEEVDWTYTVHLDTLITEQLELNKDSV